MRVSRLWRSSLVPLVLLGAMAEATRSALIDDAFISFRYARNLAEGRGLVFNPGQRVEGMSNLLWTLVLGLLHAIGVPIPGAAVALGVLGLAATVILARRVALRHGLAPATATAVGAAVALTGDLVAGSTVGLEGGLYAALLVGSALAWDGPPVAFALTITALAATRPEGLVVGAVIAGTRLLAADEARTRRLLAPGGALAGIALVELGRFAYYRQFVPMSVTAKRDIGVSVLTSLRAHESAGRLYLSGLLTRPAEVAVVIAAVVVVDRLFRARSGRAGAGRPRAEAAAEARSAPPPRHVPREQLQARQLPAVLLPLTAIVACGLGLPLFSGGDWMSHWRLVTPYVPDLYLAAALGLAAVGTRVALTAAAIGPIALAISFPAGVPTRLVGDRSSPASSAYTDVARAIERTSAPHPLVATDVLGRLAWYAPDVRFTDMFGLTGPRVAETREAGSVYGKTNLAFTASLRPAVVVTNYWPRERDLIATASSSGIDLGYVAVTSPRLSALRVFVLATPPVAAELTHLLESGDPMVAPLATTEALARWSAEYPRGF